MAFWSKGTPLFATVDRRWFEIYFGQDWPLFSPALDHLLAKKRYSLAYYFWPAILFPVPALLYRRLWVYGLGLPAVMLAAGYFDFVAGGMLGAAIALGAQLRSVVVQEAAKKISAILTRSRVASDAALEIEAAGRPSLAAATLGAFLYAAAVYVVILAIVDRPLFHPATISILVALLLIAALGSVAAWVKINNPRYLAGGLAPAPAPADTATVAPAGTVERRSALDWWRWRWRGYARTALALVVFTCAAVAFLLGMGPVWEVSGGYRDPSARVVGFASAIAILGLIASALVQLIGGRHVVSFAVGGLFVVLLARSEAGNFMEIATATVPGYLTLLLAFFLAVTATALILVPSGTGSLAETAHPWPWRFKGFLRTLIYLAIAVAAINLIASFANGQPWTLSVRLRDVFYRFLIAFPPALVVSIVVQALFGRNRVSLGAGGVSGAWFSFGLYAFFEAYERNPAFYAN